MSQNARASGKASHKSFKLSKSSVRILQRLHAFLQLCSQVSFNL
jgi:hypothetical protein